MEIIGVLIAGVVIGLLGKFVAPGDKDNIPIWMTILCGIGGVLIGWFIYAAFGGDGSAGIDWVAAISLRDRLRCGAGDDRVHGHGQEQVQEPPQALTPTLRNSPG